MINKTLQIIIIAGILQILTFVSSSVIYCSKHECGSDPNTNLLDKETTYVRPYRIYNDVNFMMWFIPHVAMDVKVCNYTTCKINSYGKAENSKIYSPDILTIGRVCIKNSTKCRKVNKGYLKSYITDWIEISQKYNESFFSFIKNETIYKTKYNLFSNNCASFVSQSLQKANVSFGCRIGSIDFPFYCSL
jgi:hypothetical protein